VSCRFGEIVFISGFCEVRVVHFVLVSDMVFIYDNVPVV